MRRHTNSAGFALLLVLWTLVILSAIALALAAPVATEVRASQDSWNDLQAERLAKSGHEFAAYIEPRLVGTAGEDLSGLPVEPLIAGLKYRVRLDIGSIDLVFEGANGNFDLGAADEDEIATFFTAWTGDSNRSREIAASIADWVDSNDDIRPFGAESQSYLTSGYRPRNGGLGTGDLFLVKGMTAEDFSPSIIDSQDRPAVRNSIAKMISAVPTGKIVNPNYASPIVLQSLPGMTQQILARIMEARQHSIFASAQDFQNRAGVNPDSPLIPRLTFNRGTSPTILAIGHLRDSPRIRFEKRTRTQMLDSRRNVQIRFTSVIERSASVE